MHGATIKIIVRTCLDRSNTEIYFLILYNSLLLSYQTYAHVNTHTHILRVPYLFI